MLRGKFLFISLVALLLLSCGNGGSDCCVNRVGVVVESTDSDVEESSDNSITPVDPFANRADIANHSAALVIPMVRVAHCSSESSVTNLRPATDIFQKQAQTTFSSQHFSLSAQSMIPLWGCAKQCLVYRLRQLII